MQVVGKVALFPIAVHSLAAMPKSPKVVRNPAGSLPPHPPLGKKHFRALWLYASP